MLNFKLFTVFALILISGIFYEDAFAAFSPLQSNANVSYNSDTNEVQLDWDFTTGPGAPVKCLLKGDFWFYDDLNNNHGNSSPTVTTYVKGFTPLYYSPVTATPVAIQASNESDAYAEVVPCQGSTRIHIDTVMSHSQNVNNWDDLQIFLTFYAPKGNTVDGDFDTTSGNLIDEVFVFYTPNDTWSTAAKDYACAGQAGNTIYIDQSAKGIHTNNGDNCSDYLELDSNQWIDIAVGGAQTPGTHVASAHTLLIQVVAQITTLVTTSHGGSDDDHNSRPTFGVDHKRNVPRVDTGLAINGMPYPILDNFHTEMPFVAIHIGEIQNFTAKVYAPHSLKIMEFLFGIPEQGSWNQAEASIEILTNFNAEALGEDITQSLTSPIINATSLQYSVSKVKCLPSDNTEPCYRVSLEFSFLEKPLGSVVALQAIDESRKNQISYFNDGLDITGESLNPPVTQQITSEIKYKGLQTVQLIDKENNIWMTMDKSEPVLLYKQNDHGTFISIEYRVFESSADPMTTNIDRLHSEFIKSIKFEQNRAVQYFDSALYLGQLDPSWSHHWKETDRMDKISDTIELEKIRTLESYEELYPDYEKTVQNFE